MISYRGYYFLFWNMYFIRNIFWVYRSLFLVYFGENESSSWALGTQEQTNQSNPEQSENFASLEEADQKLQILEATTKIATQQLNAYLNGLKRLVEKEPETRNDPEFQELLAKVERLKGLLSETKSQSEVLWSQVSPQNQSNDHVIRHGIHEIREGIAEIKSEENVSQETSELALSEEEKVTLDTFQNEYRAYREALDMKLKSFIGKTDMTNTMTSLLEEYKQLDTTSLFEKTQREQLEYFTAWAMDDLLSLNMRADIALRDEWVVWANGEKLWELRLNSINETYSKILENSEIKELLTSNDGQVPSFEELRMYHINILRDKGVNLSELFLVNENGTTLSWEIQEGWKYLINFAGNADLARNMNLAFIIRDTQEIIVDGKELRYEDGDFMFQWEKFSIQDGSYIEIKQNFQDDWEPSQDERHQSVIDRMDELGLATTQQQAIQEAMSSDNPQEAFKGMTLPGGLAGFILSMFMKMLGNKDFEYDATAKVWREVDKTVLTNAWVIDGAMGQYFQWGERIDARTSFENLPEGVRGLVNLIYQKESRGNPNMIYGGTTVNLVNMSVREVRQFQDRMVASGKPSSAVGAPQIIRSTMDGAIQAGILNPNEKFDMAAQNRFTLWKLQQRGLNEFTSGNITDLEFMKRISMEWASFPKDMSWSSYYAWDGLNKALISPQQVLFQIRKIGWNTQIA